MSRWIGESNQLGSRIELKRAPWSNEEQEALEKIADFPVSRLWPEILQPSLVNSLNGARTHYRIATFTLIAKLPELGDDARQLAAEVLIKSGPLYKGTLRDIKKFAPDCEARNEAIRRLQAGECISLNEYISRMKAGK